MSVVNGKFVCDRCGKNCGNGSVFECAIVSRLDHETGLVENLHLCMEGTRGPDGKLEEVSGCAVEILGDDSLGHYRDKLKPKL